ncbi:MAG: PEP-CTERM sorting domain-containing protein [Burkholderiales bacterium]|nr:PEP-CTERM sorting domain-containing protein [Burkholderiales bacterium]
MTSLHTSAFALSITAAATVLLAPTSAHAVIATLTYSGEIGYVSPIDAVRGGAAVGDSFTFVVKYETEIAPTVIYDPGYYQYHLPYAASITWARGSESITWDIPVSSAYAILSVQDSWDRSVFSGFIGFVNTDLESFMGYKPNSMRFTIVGTEDMLTSVQLPSGPLNGAGEGIWGGIGFWVTIEDRRPNTPGIRHWPEYQVYVDGQLTLVPEPSSVALMGLGLLSVGGFAVARRSKK